MDFLKFENQIRLFVLRLFEISKPPHENSTYALANHTMEFFNNYKSKTRNRCNRIQERS
ncbi:hypothetical protein RYX36_031789 [Vicia faba]